MFSTSFLFVTATVRVKLRRDVRTWYLPADQIMGEARLSHRGSEEVEEVSEALIHLCQYMQVCNGFGVFQPDSPTTGEVTGKASDRRYPIIGPSLSAIQEQGITKSKLITKVETRSKRNCGTRVLSNATKLMINGEIQPSRGKSQLDAGGESLEDTHHEPPVVPAVALLAMQSLEFQQRLQKEAQRYSNLTRNLLRNLGISKVRESL